MKNDTSFRPDRIGAYFRAEWLSLTFVTLSGLLYNVGLLAAPWFEGRLAQCLADILGGRAAAAQMAMLVPAYIAVTYRICGCESAREARYEDALATYEKTAVRSNVRQSALPPLYLAVASLDKEVAAMEDGPDTVIGSSGTRLSGGQAQRLALARTLAHPRPVLVLDDPFSALDRGTEGAIFAGLQAYAKDKVVFLISHRLYHFPLLQQIIFMEDGQTTVGTHQELMVSVPVYRQLYESQAGGEQA